jgi:hypothetical protein
MKNEECEVMTPEAVRAKEEYLFSMGAGTQKEIEELKAPVLFVDKNGEQYIYCNGKYERVDLRKPDHIVKAEAFETFSLDGLIDFIKADTEGQFDGDFRHMVRVKSPTLVEVIAPKRGYWQERELVAYCKAVVPDISFGRYMDTEQFQIMVQTCFMESENRAKVLQVAGSVRKEQNMQTADDGVSQKITVNAGVSTATDVIVKNPVTLIPFRTFREVEQPESPFVLRFNEDGNAALFTGDGSKWKLEAVSAIRQYLQNALRDDNVDIIA